MNREELAELINSGVAASVKELLGPEAQRSNGGGIADLFSKHVPQPKEEVKGQSVSRMVRALAASHGDRERAAAFAKKHFNDDFVAKALGTGTNEGGGFIVPVEQSTDIIELLRPRSVVRRMNPVIMPMATGVLTIPRLASGANAEYVGESTSQNATEQTFGQLRLTWKKLRATVPISNELLAFSNPQVDAVVRDDLVMAMATREDLAFIRDDGTGAKLKGLRYWAPAANVTASNGTDAAAIQQDFKDLLDTLESADVRMLRPGWLMAPRTKNALINLRSPNGELIYPEMRNATPIIYGYPVAVTTNIPTNLGAGGNETEIYFVDFADAVIGEASQLIIETSNEASYTDGAGNLVSAFDRDETVIKVLSRHDFVLRHDASVAIKNAITWT